MRTLHIVSHTHWDREWYQTFQHFRIRLVHLLDNVLALLADDINFQFFSLDGQTIVLEDYLAVRPERAAEIKAHIQSGRLLIGPWYILPDEFLVSPEAIVRNLLIGAQTSAAFGPKMQVGYIPDPFGHIGQMPQILTGFGIRTASVQRGLDDEPCEFWWQAPDGSVVFMAYLRDGYGNAAGLPAHDHQRFCSEVIRLGDSLAKHSAASNLLLMFGTDHMEPPAETSQALAYANSCLDGLALVHSTLPAYLDAVQDELSAKGADLPVVHGELRSSKRSPMLPGVLSARIWIKQRNHACESLLERWAEPFSAWASLAAGDPPLPGYRTSERLQTPAALLRQAWRLLLTCQPHDSICGCSIDQVHEEMRPRFDQVEQMGEIITSQSLQELADVMDTSCDPDWAAMAVCVFNPALAERTDLVEVMLELPEHITNFEVVDQFDQPMPHQTLGLGRQELINVIMSTDEFLAAAANVQDGRVSGLVIQKITHTRQDDTVLVDIILTEHGEPNREAFDQGMQTLKLLAENPVIKRFAVRAHSADQVRLRFIASSIPGPGAKTFWIVPKPQLPSKPVELPAIARLALPLVSRLSRIPAFKRLAEQLAQPKSKARPPYMIQNEFLAVEASPASGLVRLVDKRTNQLFENLNCFTDGADRGDEYNYCPPQFDELINLTRLQRVEINTSPIGQQMILTLSLRVPKALDESRQRRSAEKVDLTIKSTISLWTGVPRLEIHTEVNNLAADHRLRVHFPTPYMAHQALFDGHFEIARRKIGLPAFDASWVEEPRPEQPQRLFCGLNEGRYGLLLAARGLPEVEACEIKGGSPGSELALTLLRCVGWLSRDDLSNRKGHAGPGMPVPGAQMIGTHSFDYALIPYFEDPANAFSLARDFHAPLRASPTGLHSGKLDGSPCLLTVTPVDLLVPQNFVLSTIKQAEDGSGLVVRGYNQTSQLINFNLRPWRRFAQVKLLRLDEETVGSIQPDIDGSIVYSANPYEILTFKFSD